MTTTPAKRHASYGIDAPGTLVGLAIGSLITLAVLVATFNASPGWWLTVPFLLAPVAAAASFLYTTLRGKHIAWSRELDRMVLRGDERALDLGCGRGLVLIALAQRLPRGRATGIDRWRAVDQTGNDAQATRRNADAEDVDARVELVTADMRRLPFADASFDLVVSSLAIHNIHAVAERRAAVAEGYRVTRPGGRIRIADFRNAREYAAALRDEGAVDVTTHPMGWRFWYGGPFFATTMLCARRPPSG